MPTERKIEIVGDLSDKLTRAQLTLVADYRGLTVAEITDLRQKLRETGAELMVAKNTLTLIAARSLGFDAIESLLAGPTALAFAYDDVPKVVRAINEFNKGPKKLAVRGGMLGKSLLKEDVLERVVSLPTRQEVLAQVVGGVASPVSSLVGLIAAPVSDVVNIINAAANSVLYALQARIDQLQSAGEQGA